MSTLWANVDRGLKTTLGQQCSGEYSLASHKKFTLPHHPLQEKIREFSIFSQICFISGEQMSTLWANGDRGLNSTFGQQCSVQYSLTPYKKFTQPHQPLQEKNRWVSIFSQFCFTPVEQMSTLWANGQGLKIDNGIESSGQYSLTSHKKFTQTRHPLQKKIR